MRKALLGVTLALWFAPAAHAATPRLLFQSDWSGTAEIYAADPTGGRPVAQITFGRAPTCDQAGCGYGDAVPSPDGRFILYSDFAACSLSSRRSSLFVARADGTHPRMVARSRSKSDCPRALDGAWSPDSKRIAYAADGRIHVIDADGRNNRVVGRGDQPSWSPAGKSIAFSAPTPSGGYGPLLVVRNGRTRVVTASAAYFEWSPNGRWLAYSFAQTPSGPDEVDIVRPNGTARRSLVTTAYLDDPKWSADSRFLAAGGELVTVASGMSRRLGSELLAWRPRGHAFASSDTNGISVVNAATGATRLLTTDHGHEASWSPDGRFLAYITETTSYIGIYGNPSVRVVTLAGKTRTVVSTAGPYGGFASWLAWTRVPKGLHYRPARPRVLAVMHGDGLTARWTITHLAADGGRVAYTSCGHVFVWTPSTKTVVQAEPSSSLSPRCTTPGNYWPFWLYTLALSGNRIAFGDLSGNSGQQWALYAGRLEAPSSLSLLGDVPSVNGCAVGAGGLGDLTGAGGLLVFSTWRDDFHCPARTLEQHILRVGGEACPCPVIAFSQGPLVPFDVADGRIVAGGENATVVYDAAGTELLAVPVSPLAAQLSASDLVVLVQGHLLEYDATTGARLHDWPLAGVPSGSECGSPHYGTWECRDAQLVLEDAARDLAAYVLNGEVHVVELQSGADVTVGKGTLARFMNAGLVYADGADLHLIPLDRLPV